MTGPLTDQLRKEHAKLMPHVDELRVIADYAPEIPHGSLRERLVREHEFLVREFVPHMDSEQRVLYPIMEPLLEQRPELGAVTHAHDAIQRLIDALGRLSQGPASGGPERWVLESRRALYELYALLKVHLAEEELNAPLIESELSENLVTAVAARLEFGAQPNER